MYIIYIYNTAYKKRAGELKVCPGWFGRRKHLLQPADDV